jgi:polyisoprenoid-binding protein YceI
MTLRIVLYTLLAILIPAAAISQAPARKAQGARRPAPSASVHLALAPAGNEARFIVREHLMTSDLPGDAIGTTKAISGGIVIGADGKIDPTHSAITVQMATLTTDQEHRDTWIKEHTLKTDSFPTTVFVVRELQGLPAKLPSSGTMALKMVGDFTLHGVTKPWTWDVTLTANGNEYTGRATTHLKFGDFGMEQPRLMIVMSVVDDVKLEYDFHFVKSAS